MRVPRARGGEHSRQESVIRRLHGDHAGALAAYAVRLAGGPGPEAEAAVREALITASRRPDLLVRGRGAVRGLLLAAVRSALAGPEAEGAPPSHDGAAADRWPDVLQALEHLRPEHRRLLAEIHGRGRSLQEAADTLGLSAAAAGARLRAALAELHAVLRTEQPPP
ncbi:hypothetical protein LO771_29260 [Streptacidiphilus sp. ASG 303]|uniref:hypothetical protein n=1 Tax=Streptacidiphilus sp. ASG 303 TaxID=2896847 RepID=UPI001E5213F3|nr:hypothetical protein [Streptacidiphilus sp. ASG 303]MCD0486361.1 hypothetical protein [Streptacidiphilus sp. ASG 303]